MRIKNLGFICVFLYILSFTLSIVMFFAWNYPKKFSLDIEKAKNNGMHFGIEHCSITPKKISIAGWAFTDSGGRGTRIYIFLLNKKTGEKIEVPLRTLQRSDIIAKNGTMSFNKNPQFDMVGFSASLCFLGHADDYSNLITIVINDQNANIFKKTYVCQ